MFLVEYGHPCVGRLSSLLRVSLPSVQQRLVLTLFRAAEDTAAQSNLRSLLNSVSSEARPGVKVSVAIALFDVARRRLAQSLHRIQHHPRYSQVWLRLLFCHAHAVTPCNRPQVLVQVDPVMASWVCEEEGQWLDSDRNPFAGMDAATSAPATPDLGDGTNSSFRPIIHPASLSATSALLATIVDLLVEAKDQLAASGSSEPSQDSLLIQAKHMLDMTRVLKTELPADAAMDRL